LQRLASSSPKSVLGTEAVGVEAWLGEVVADALIEGLTEAAGDLTAWPHADSRTMAAARSAGRLPFIGRSNG
jgi:hypothetical protein